MNHKFNKKALLASVLSLLLCMAMLVGTTFAWFTDTASSTGNKIVAGKLNVDLELLDEETNVWESVKDDNDPIFNYEDWEPGYTDVKLLRVENQGTLALKWKAVFVSATSLSDLANVIDVYVKPYGVVADASTVVYPTDRALDGYVRVGTVAEFVNTIEETTNGILLEGETAYLGIALKMQETAGNEYQEMDLGAFDINIVATQLASEFDSIDNKYDEGATFGTYIELNAGDDLLAAMKSAQANMPLTIKLNGDVEWPTEGHHGENDITPASSIVIDGNGHTITATGEGVTPLGDVEAPMTLKNVKIVDNSVSYNEDAWEFTYLEIGGSRLTCDNVIFAGGILLGTNATFTDCSFESNEESVYAVWVADGSATFTDCTFTGTRGMKICDMYAPEIGTVVIDGCTFMDLTQKPGVAIDDEDTQDMKITIKNSTFINCQPGDQRLYIYETDNTVPTVENNRVATTVGNAEDLASALTSDDASISVVLTEDIDLPISSLGTQTPGSGEYKLGGDATESITIDLNGKKLTITTSYMSAIGAKNVDATITIKNGTMNSTGNSSTTWNINDLIFANCNYVIENVVFNKEVALENTGKTVNMKNVTINGTGDYYALWISARGQNVTIDGLTINSNGRGIKIDEQYVGTPDKVTLNVSNASFNTVKKAAIMVKSSAGADITLNNVNIANTVDTVNAVWNDADSQGSFDSVTVTGGTKLQEN